MRNGDPSARKGVCEVLSKMEAISRTELGTSGSPVAHKVLKSLREHWSGLTLFLDDPRILSTTMPPNGP